MSPFRFPYAILDTADWYTSLEIESLVNPRMSTTASWVAEAVKTLSLDGQVRRLEDPERSDILRHVKDRFLEWPGVLFWWSHLKSPWEAWHTEHGYRHLPELCADWDSRCWFITGLSDSDNEKGVFECSPTQASALIAESPGFEYAVVDRELKGLVIENHHDVLFAAGDASPRLARLRG